MALTAVPIKPVEVHSLDDPRRPPTATDELAIPQPQNPSQPSTPAPSPQPQRRTPRDAPRDAGVNVSRAAANAASAARPRPSPDTAPPPEHAPVNPYARDGRPHQVALSLYAPQWQTIEQQCAELRADGVPDATVTRWLFALLHFHAPQQPDAAENLVRRLARLEADEDGPYFGLRKEARGVRLFTALWERQRSIVTELRRDSTHRPTLATWTTAVFEFYGPRTPAEARALLRALRILLAGDPA
ncbi:MAG: hypothetical protein ACLP0J_02960 [Solirubrobacteraceae bacterium]